MSDKQDRPPPDFEKMAREAQAKGANDVHKLDDIIDGFNDTHFVSHEGGTTFVYREDYDRMLGRDVLRRMRKREFVDLYSHVRMPLGQTTKSIADIWFNNPQRRSFTDGVVFDPSGQAAPLTTYNLWRGFGVEPKPGDWSLLRDHVRTVICPDDDVAFTYLLKWMARLVQHPAEPGETAVVMRGGEGTGKGTLARALMHLLGQHGMQVANAKHLVGNFNSHLRDCIFLFADEAFFAGDRQHVGVLKSIITERVLTVEAKYRDPVQASNFLHVMMASNLDWVVPAAIDARRFLMLDVSKTRANDHAYFSAIWRQMEGGGYEAMLHDLLHLDLTGFDHRAVPSSVALDDQKDQSLPVKLEWWQAVLYRGYVYDSRHGFEDYFMCWRQQESTKLLYASYEAFARSHGERHLMTAVGFGRFMQKLGARPRNLHRNPVVGEHVIHDGGSRHMVAELLNQNQAHGYSIGSLAEARKAFERLTTLRIEWPEVWEVSGEGGQRFSE